MTKQELDLKKQAGGHMLFPDNTMGKIVEGEYIIKPCCGRKNFSHDWVENVKPEDIDDRYYNPDGTPIKPYVFD